MPRPSRRRRRDLLRLGISVLAVWWIGGRDELLEREGGVGMTEVERGAGSGYR